MLFNVELCFLFISLSTLSFKGQNYISLTAEPRTCALLLLRVQLLNSPVGIPLRECSFPSAETFEIWEVQAEMRGLTSWVQITCMQHLRARV